MEKRKNSSTNKRTKTLRINLKCYKTQRTTKERRNKNKKNERRNFSIVQNAGRRTKKI